MKQLRGGAILLALASFCSSASALEYRIRPGDTLSEIAARFGVTVQAIQAANGLRGTRIIAGEKLTIPDRPGQPAAAPAQPAGSSTSYRVKPGDSLDRIARRHGVSVSALRRVNDLLGDGSLIHPGQSLVIPGAGAPTTPAPTTPAPRSPAPATPAPATGATTSVAIRHAPMQATPEEVEILARIVKGECWHSTPQVGRVAVAATVLNRVRSPDFPSSIRAVAHQPKQFSCYNVRMRKRLYAGPIPQEAWDAARAALAGEDPTGGATHYFNPYLVKPKWARQMKRIIRIGTNGLNSHDFYRW